MTSVTLPDDASGRACKCPLSETRPNMVRELIEIVNRRDKLRLVAFVESLCFNCGAVVEPKIYRGYFVSSEADIKRLRAYRIAAANAENPFSRVSFEMPPWGSIGSILQLPVASSRTRRPTERFGSPAAEAYVAHAYGLRDGEDRAIVPTKLFDGEIYIDRNTVRHIAKADVGHFAMVLFGRTTLANPVEIWHRPKYRAEPARLLFMAQVVVGYRVLTDFLVVDDERKQVVTGYELDLGDEKDDRRHRIEEMRSMPSKLLYAAWAKK